MSLNRGILAFALIFGLALAQGTMASELTLEERLQDFASLNTIIQKGYAPLHHKQNIKKVDFLSHKQNFEAKIRNAKSTAEFYYLLIQYVAGFHDSHFGAYLNNSYAKFAPIMTDLIEGKVLVSAIIGQLMKPDTPVEVGDEILEVDGRAVQELAKELSSYYGQGYEYTERTIGAWVIFGRRAARLPAPTKDVSIVKAKSWRTGQVHEFSVNWFEMGENLPDETLRVQSLGRKGSSFNADDFSFNRESLGLPNVMAERTYMCNDGTRINKPDGAVEIMSEPFVAYTYPTAAGPVGYLRIAHYTPSNDKGEPEFDLRAKQYEYVVKKLEESTVGLIIDQQHNCGGSVTYLEQLLGLFMTKRYEPIKFAIRADKEMILGFKGWVSALNPLTLEREWLGKVFDDLKAAWQKGDWFAPSQGLSGKPHLEPSPYHYTKPIIVLIDHLSASGGDAFPAMMQGLGRAKLLGTRTMGAGGHVEQQSPLPFSRLNFALTRSMFFHPNGTPIEDYGAVPDIDYDITRGDLLNGYTPFREFYTGKLLGLLGVKAEKK